MVGVTEIDVPWPAILRLGAFAFVGAFIVTGRVFDRVRLPLRARLLVAARERWKRAEAATWKPAWLAHKIVEELTDLIAYLLDCRRCLAVEIALLWSWRTGWLGWTNTLAAAAIAVAVYELWAKPEQ